MTSSFNAARAVFTAPPSMATSARPCAARLSPSRADAGSPPRPLPMLQVWNAAGNHPLTAYQAVRDFAWKQIVDELQALQSLSRVTTVTPAPVPVEVLHAAAPVEVIQASAPMGRLYPSLSAESLLAPYPELRRFQHDDPAMPPLAEPVETRQLTGRSGFAYRPAIAAGGAARYA